MSNIVFEGFYEGKVLDGIINERDLNGDEKTILITISFYHKSLIGENPAMSLPMDKVCELVNCSKTTANRIMKKLIEKGYLESIKRGQGKPNIYVFKGWRKWQ